MAWTQSNLESNECWGKKRWKDVRKEKKQTTEETRQLLRSGSKGNNFVDISNRKGLCCIELGISRGLHSVSGKTKLAFEATYFQDTFVDEMPGTYAKTRLTMERTWETLTFASRGLNSDFSSWFSSYTLHEEIEAVSPTSTLPSTNEVLVYANDTLINDIVQPKRLISIDLRNIHIAGDLIILNRRYKYILPHETRHPSAYIRYLPVWHLQQGVLTKLSIRNIQIWKLLMVNKSSIPPAWAKIK